MKETIKQAAIKFANKCLLANIAGGLDNPYDEMDMINAFEEGAEFQAKQSPWISVEDRLPDTDSGQSLYEVLVQTRDHRYNVEVNVYVERMAEKGEITHWMSIPE